MNLDKILLGNIVNSGVFFFVGMLPPYPPEMGYSLEGYSLLLGGIAGTVNWKALEYLDKKLWGREPVLSYAWDEAAATCPGAIAGFYLGATVGRSIFR